MGGAGGLTPRLGLTGGAGDGNRTRTLSLGMETMLAWAHGGQGQGCPYLTVSARQGSFVDR
jgi:hypothetical protein